MSLSGLAVFAYDLHINESTQWFKDFTTGMLPGEKNYVGQCILEVFFL